MKYNIWKIPYMPPRPPEALLRAGFSPLLSLILALRGYGDAESAQKFLSADTAMLVDPYLLTDMAPAVERIRLAVRQHEKVAVYGDYDVDGITSTCLLTGFLRSLGLDCTAYIPDRICEGYGLNSAAIDTLSKGGATLIITVDCGVTGIAEARHAREIGVDMIITDHHECMDTLPEAVAVIDPKRPGSLYPNTDLAGVGVAFKLICAIDGSAERCLEQYCDLVAVGTIADVMPLTGENRVITEKGLEKLQRDPVFGLHALIAEAGLGDKRITAGSIGFTLAPRINAAGRLGQATRAAELLMSQSSEQAFELAGELCRLNRSRQQLELEIWNEALAMLGDEPPRHPIVLASSGWHQGVIGIVASRLTEAFGLPAIMICLDGENGKGSCRSYGGFNLFEALTACSSHLVSFGGHAMAAGLNIRRENIGAFRQALAEYYDSNPPTSEISLCVDLRIDSAEMLSMSCVSSLEKLEPCGNGNPKPLLCITGAELLSVVPIGGGKHLRLRVRKFGQIYECVFFSCTPEELGAHEGELIDIAFYPQINEFRSRRSVQLLVTDVRPHDRSELCRRLLSGLELSPGDAADCLPRRSDLAVLWRQLLHMPRAPIPVGDVLNVCGLYSPMACAGLAAFSELGLVSLSENGGHTYISINRDTPKVELSNSATLRRLSDAAGRAR